MKYQYISKRQLMWLLLYTAIFPISQIIDVVMLGILLTAPFLAIAYITGMMAVAIVNTEIGYLPGATIGIFVQALLLVLAYNKLRRPPETLKDD